MMHFQNCTFVEQELESQKSEMCTRIIQLEKEVATFPQDRYINRT